MYRLWAPWWGLRARARIVPARNGKGQIIIFVSVCFVIIKIFTDQNQILTQPMDGKSCTVCSECPDVHLVTVVWYWRLETSKLGTLKTEYSKSDSRRCCTASLRGTSIRYIDDMLIPLPLHSTSTEVSLEHSRVQRCEAFSTRRRTFSCLSTLIVLSLRMSADSST